MDRSPQVANLHFPEPRLPLVLACGLLASLLVHSATAAPEAAPSEQAPGYYVGVGIRGGKGDATAAVIDSKIRLAGPGDVTVSTRPALLMGGYDTEFMASVNYVF